MTEPSSSEPAPFVIPARARLAETEASLDALRAAAGAPELVLDARAVEEITTPFVTALVSVIAARKEAGRSVAVLSPTPAFIDAFSDLGLFQDLMKMEFRQ